jgi:hypothetical protein
MAARQIRSGPPGALVPSGVTFIGPVGWQAGGPWAPSSSHPAASSMDIRPARGDSRRGTGARGQDHRHRTPSLPASSGPARRREADGAVTGGLTLFDNRSPAVTNLVPGLPRAHRHAATDAKRAGVEIVVTSGWRSRGYQRQLLRQAVATYGSEWAAARWVAAPERSSHVSGDAVDVGPSRAAAWLSRHGARYGLCQIYRNEPWHYELRLDAIDGGCPAMYLDPTHDPRMQP